LLLIEQAHRSVSSIPMQVDIGAVSENPSRVLHSLVRLLNYASANLLAKPCRGW